MERRFIEESFPIRSVSDESSKEKSIRHSHISLLHIWWARRPLIASRATLFTSLISYPHQEKEIETSTKLIESISTWKNSLNQEILKNVQQLIKKEFPKKPKILDPFAGGGSIPVESLRLGCETYASDYNPVATLILKSSLEYPQKYGGIEKRSGLTLDKKNPLIEDLKKWSNWVLTESKKEIEEFYHYEKGTIVGFIWARTVPCQNPNCGIEIPLMRQFWVANRKNKKLFLFPKINGKKINFELMKESNSFNPSKGSVSRAHPLCLACNTVMDAKTNRKLFIEKKSDERLIAIVFQKKGSKNKEYSIATNDDLKLFDKARLFLINKEQQLKEKSSINPVPDEIIPEMSGTFNVPLYGYTKWGDLFNSRQKLAHIVFVEKIKESHQKMIKQGYDENYAKALATYLAFIMDRVLDYNSNLCMWAPVGEFIAHTFGRQALPMVWDYFELNPFSDSTGNWNSSLKWIITVLEHLCQLGKTPATVQNTSAISLEYDDGFFDAVITDPPYYNSVPYSDLSDFFYVWLKRSIGFLYPELFSTPLTPKTDEIVEMASWDKKRYAHKTKSYFEKNLSSALKEISRVLTVNGICVLVYAHKSTDGWETLINSILNSGLVLTAAWPINTERPGRLRANDSAALASSIYMVARKMKKEPIGFYQDVKKELKVYLNKKLEHLWNEGISGADFFIASIGSAIQVFGKYEKVVDDNDEKISVRKLLNDTRKIVTNYAINKVIKGEFSEEISTMTRFYILWRWAYGEAKVPFDDALKMAQSVGIDIEHEWNKGFIKKDKEFIRVLGPDERTEKELSDPHDLIDILHNALLLWKKEKRETVEKFLEEKGYKNSEVFKRVAQAISESLPLESTEKKWLDGFLTGFKRDDSPSGVQSKLYD